MFRGGQAVRRDEGGFTLVELLVTLTIFAVASTAFFQLMLGGTRGSNRARQVARVSEEARAGLNRMIRDTREGSNLTEATPSSYTVQVDFNADGNYQNPNAQGDFEVLTFALSGSAITLNGETLIAGVAPIGTQPVFQYSSRMLDHDTNPVDGVATLSEIQQAAASTPSVGDPLAWITTVSYSFKLTNGDASTDFYGKAELRNSLR